MKKLLALVMALVMSMSLVTISNAAFADAKDIDFGEAVDVMAAVGVIAGTDNNKFDPKAELTREQAAKIIAYLDLGEKTAEALVGAGTFADVAATRWSAGYIDYCAQAGYVDGVGNNCFNPTGKLTGLQFAKMLLCALGYDAARENMTGTDWSIAVAKLAGTNDLFDGISKNPSAVFTREEAAQMAFNALKADTYDYDIDGTTVKGDGFEVITGGSKASKVENYKFDYQNDEDDYVMQLCEKLYGEDITKTAVDDGDAFGRPATRWDYDGKEVGTYADKADKTFADKVTKKALYEAVGKTVYNDINDDTATLTVYVDGDDLGDSLDLDHYMSKKETNSIGYNGSDDTTKLTGNGTLTEVYVDDENNVTVVIINTYLFQATDDYNAKKGTVSIEGVWADCPSVSELSDEDFAIADIDDEDYLLITYSEDTEEVQSVAKAKVVTGKVTTYSNDSAVIGGDTYKYAFLSEDGDTDYTIGEEAKVVTDGKYILAVEEASVVSDKYVYVAEIATKGEFDTSKDFIGKAYFLDGTQKTINLKDEFADKSDVEATTDGAWYTYTVNSSDKYTLAKISGDIAKDVIVSDGDEAIANNKIAIDDGTYKLNSKTVIVVIDDDDEVAAYTGFNSIPSIEAKDGTLTVSVVLKDEDSSYAKYVFIDASENAKIDNASKSSDMIYVLKKDSTHVDGDKNTYYLFKAIVNGEETTFKANDADWDAYQLYTDVKYDKNGYVDDMNKVDESDDFTADEAVDVSSKTVTYSDGVLSIDDTDFAATKAKVYLIAADSQNNINEDAGSTYDVSTMTAKGLASTLKGYTVSGEYFAQMDEDGEYLVALYFYLTSASK